MKQKKEIHNDEALWEGVMEGATETLDALQKYYEGDPQMGLAAIALAMAYLLAITKTPEARRQALYECVEDRVGDAASMLTPQLEQLLFQASAGSKLVH